MSEKLPWHWIKWFGYLIGLIVFVIAVVGYARNVKALRNQVIADTATIDAQTKAIDVFKDQLADAADEIAANSEAYAQCQESLRAHPTAAPAPADSDYLTVLVSQVSVSGPAAAPAAQSPIVALGNAYRPGLGTIVGGLLNSRSAPDSAPSTYTVGWVVPGRVTPYIAPGDSAVVGYSWLNVKTGTTETRQPDPVGKLLAQLGVR
jgi:hypothetical protein